jgi:hypothetical protein
VRILAASRARVYRKRVQEARVKAVADARDVGLSAGGVTTFEASEAMAIVEQIKKAVERSTHMGACRPSNWQAQLAETVAMLAANTPAGAPERGAASGSNDHAKRRAALVGLA